MNETTPPPLWRSVDLVDLALARAPVRACHRIAEVRPWVYASGGADYTPSAVYDRASRDKD
jgi:hypothetical protein